MEPQPDRTVVSRDGTNLAVWVAGSGPPMVLVHGSFGDHTGWSVPLEVLTRRYTTYAMDRRGFGASSDMEPYTIELEFDDVAAVVEAAAEEHGGPVILWGHSYGANCAMGGAARTQALSHLVLYEPSFGLSYPPGSIEAAEAKLAEGDRSGAVESMLRDALDLSQEDIEALKASPRWPNLLAGAHTAPRECRVEEEWVYRPGQFDGITAPTLMLAGTESPGPLREATNAAARSIGGVVIEELEGHGHFAHRSDPEMVVEIIDRFVAAH